MKPDQITQPPQPPQEMTDEELEAFKKKLDQMYLANRYLRTPRPRANPPPSTNSTDATAQGAAKAETP
jgi:hypothetical protein